MALDLVWQQHPLEMPNVTDIIGTSEEKNCRSGKRYGSERGFRCFGLGEYFLVFQKYILRNV